jgi:hypothetical protein
MRYAILDEQNIVIALVEADEAPPSAVKGHDESAEVGRVWNGWTFQEGETA